MSRICLVHWQEAQAREHVAELEASGYHVLYEPDGASVYRLIRRELPDAVLIDLGRLPSHGKEVALACRGSAATRRIPLIFVDGAPEKVEALRRALPDALYTTWDEVHPILAEAIANPPADPVVPHSNPSGYSGTPLPKKLGIKPGYTVLLDGAPDGFEAALGELPPDVELTRGVGCGELTLWFVRSREELEAGIAERAERLGAGGLWIANPKKASGVRTDVTQDLVRDAGMAAGLVDYKVCAIDEVWTALKFARRKSEAPRSA